MLAIGAFLTPEKCFWYMLDYECSDWERSPRELVDWELMIPMDDGIQHPIHSLSSHDIKKALGVEDCPAGGSVAQLETIKGKVEKWMYRMKNGHLSAGWT